MKWAILPAADGSLVLKADAVLPAAFSRRGKYKQRDVKSGIYSPKVIWVGHKKLKDIDPTEIAKQDLKELKALAADGYWRNEIKESVCHPASLCQSRSLFVASWIRGYGYPLSGSHSYGMGMSLRLWPCLGIPSGSPGNRQPVWHGARPTYLCWA